MRVGLAEPESRIDAIRSLAIPAFARLHSLREKLKTSLFVRILRRLRIVGAFLACASHHTAGVLSTTSQPGAAAARAVIDDCSAGGQRRAHDFGLARVD